ncbi:MAG TPA: hypothetical protein VFD19_03490, partial [Clostridia bacterium]|nr:hypothetical protein [Clostridia bacterium]
IDRLKLEESQLGSRLEALNRNLGYARADLLATVSRYAGPSEVEEVDDIITMLSRQRDSSAEYNETVSDLLRRIAELKHGRSEDEMSREYDRVCRQLYGDFNDPALASNSLYTKELFYDPEHLRQISERRMELAEQIDELAAGIQDHKSILKASREATVAIGSLERKCDTLNESLQEARNDLLRLDSSIVWLEELLASWTEIDVMVCMGRTTRYLNRLMGRRDAKTLRMTPLLIPNTAMRPPKLLDKESVSGQLSGTADYSIFSTAPSEFRYLAFRLALSDLQDREQSQAGPLIWIDPVIPDELSFQDELVSALEEWTLETGRQIIYFTRASRLIALANDRKMKVYNIE